MRFLYLKPNAWTDIRAPVSPSKHKTFYNICTMVGERRRPWGDVVQMLYDCFVFTGSSHKGLFDLNI